MNTMHGTHDAKSAAAAGWEDGESEMVDLYNQKGPDALRRATASGHPSLEEAAINAGVADLRCIPEELHGAYYEAYRAGAESAVESLLYSLDDE